MTTATTLHGRLRAARKAAGFRTISSFIKAHKIPISTYSQHETGRRKPQHDALIKYSQIFNINLNWLKYGNGNPYEINDLEQTRTTLADEMLDLTSMPAVKIISTTNEILLARILKKILELFKNKKTSLERIANIVSGIYSDIVSIENSPDMQIRMIEAAIRSFKRCEDDLTHAALNLTQHADH